MNSQSRVLIARLPSFEVACSYRFGKSYSDFIFCNQTTVYGDEKEILAVFECHGQIIHSSIIVVKIVERTSILGVFFSSTNCRKADLISAKTPFLTV